jgi:hypothetical protein
MNRLLICGLWSLLRLVADSVRIPCVMASQSPSPGTESSSSKIPEEPRRGLSGALIGLILIGAVAGVAAVGLWALNQLASRSPAPQETVAPPAVPETPAAPDRVPVEPEPVPTPADPQLTPEATEAAQEEMEAALDEVEVAPRP